MAADTERRLYQVVINHEQQYSIWPAGRSAPAGWTSAGFAGSLEECTAYVDQVWTDMRPLSLRAEQKAVG